MLLFVSVLLGIVKAFQMPAQQALTPSLVPPEVLPRALAFSSMGSQAAIVAGPALGGFIYVAGAQAVYLTCGVLFALAGTLINGVRYDHAPAPRQIHLDTLLAGVRFVRHRPVVLGAISLDLFAVLLGGATALLPIFARDILHTGPWGLGLLRAAPAAGAFALSLLLTRWPITRRAGRVLLGAVALYGAATLVFGVSTSFALSMAALVVAGAADMVSVVIRQSLVQLDTPDDMRGRVSAVNSVFIGASNQLGEFESGRDRGAARAGRLGAARRRRHAAGRRRLAAPVPGAGAARPAGVGRRAHRADCVVVDEPAALRCGGAVRSLRRCSAPSPRFILRAASPHSAAWALPRDFHAESCWRRSTQDEVGVSRRVSRSSFREVAQAIRIDAVAHRAARLAAMAAIAKGRGIAPPRERSCDVAEARRRASPRRRRGAARAAPACR